MHFIIRYTSKVKYLQSKDLIKVLRKSGARGSSGQKFKIDRFLKIV
jgi:hypothetical protein